MNTRTVPGQTKTSKVQVGDASGNTVGTAVMNFDQVTDLLSDHPLRCPRRQRLEDLEAQDDLKAARAALKESDERLAYDDVRKELGLGD